jgi:hypothetical protein
MESLLQWKKTLHFVCVAELRVTGNYMQIECCTKVVLWQIYVPANIKHA